MSNKFYCTFPYHSSNFVDYLDNIFYAEINENFNIKELLKYEYLEELIINYEIDEYIDLSELVNLKKLTIYVSDDIKIILPKFLENLIILSDSFSSYINLLNYENLINLYIDYNVHPIINLNKCEKLKKIIINSYKHSENVDLSNCNDLEYLTLSIDDITSPIYINLKNCNKLKYLNLSINNEERINIDFPINSDLKKIELFSGYEFSKITINNLYSNHKISNIRINKNLDFSNFPNLEKLTITDLDNKFKEINISKNFKLNYLELTNDSIKYINIPNKNINFVLYNCNFSNKRIISRRRMYFLCENKDYNFNIICPRCKKNIINNFKVNIRKEDNKYNYLSCC